MTAAFKVEGQLSLTGASGFVADANAASTALKGVNTAAKEVAQGGAAATTATASLTETTRAATTATVTQTQALAAAAKAQLTVVAGSATAAASAQTQAAGFARLAQQTAIDAARSQSSTLMASVQGSTESIKALYSGAATASKTQTTALASVAAGSINAAASSKVLKAANDDVGKSVDAVAVKLNTFQKTQLGFQLNDVFTQIASGQSVLRTAVQQGPQITQIFGGIGNTLKAIPLAAVGYGAAIAAVVAVTIGATARLAELRAENLQLENSLQVTGRAAEVTATQLQQVILAESNRAGPGRSDTQQAALQLIGNNQLAGDAVQRTLALARDLARVTGQDLPTAAQALSSGLDGTVAGAKKLDATFNALTPAELEQVRRYEELGQKGNAIGVVLTALERNLKGANERGLTPAAAAVNSLSKAWDNLGNTVANSKFSQTMLFVATNIAKGATMFANGGPTAAQLNGQGPTSEDVAEARTSLERLKGQLETLRDQLATAAPLAASTINRAITRTQVQIADATANLNSLESQTAAVTAKAVTDQVTSQATALKNQTKDAVALLDRANTVAAQRRQLEGERAQGEQAIKSGLLDPDQLARVQERITQINGQLTALRTPAQELQRSLDLESTLSKLPPQLQAAERAFQETKRQALEQGQSADAAEKAANQARANVLQQQATATGQQIQLLSAEAQGALKVAAAYDVSRAAALALAAQTKAEADEAQGTIAPDTAGDVAQQTLEETAASAIAAAASKNQAYALEVAGLGRLVDAEGKSSAAARETQRANTVATYAEDLRAQAAATNNAVIIAAAEKQIATYDRLTKAQQAAEIRRDANQLNTQFDPGASLAERRWAAALVIKRESPRRAEKILVFKPGSLVDSLALITVADSVLEADCSLKGLKLSLGDEAAAIAECHNAVDEPILPVQHASGFKDFQLRFACLGPTSLVSLPKPRRDLRKNISHLAQPIGLFHRPSIVDVMPSLVHAKALPRASAAARVNLGLQQPQIRAFVRTKRTFLSPTLPMARGPHAYVQGESLKAWGAGSYQLLKPRVVDGDSHSGAKFNDLTRGSKCTSNLTLRDCLKPNSTVTPVSSWSWCSQQSDRPIRPALQPSAWAPFLYRSSLSTTSANSSGNLLVRKPLPRAGRFQLVFERKSFGRERLNTANAGDSDVVEVGAPSTFLGGTRGYI